MKKVFVLLVVVFVALLVVTPFTKPSELEHYAAVRTVAMKVAAQKMASMPVPDALADVASDEHTSLGSTMAQSAIDGVMRQSFEVNDYVFASVGTVHYHGMNVPITIGILGKVHLLADESKIQSIIH